MSFLKILAFFSCVLGFSGLVLVATYHAIEFGMATWGFWGGLFGLVPVIIGCSLALWIMLKLDGYE